MSEQQELDRLPSLELNFVQELLDKVVFFWIDLIKFAPNTPDWGEVNNFKIALYSLLHKELFKYPCGTKFTITLLHDYEAKDLLQKAILNAKLHSQFPVYAKTDLKFDFSTSQIEIVSSRSRNGGENLLASYHKNQNGDWVFQNF